MNRNLGVSRSSSGIASYYPAFLDQVRQELTSDYGPKDLNSIGLRIFTTLKTRSQETLQETVSRALNDIEKQRGIPQGSLESAAIIANSQTGEILAMVGGRDAKVDGFNRAINLSLIHI